MIACRAFSPLSSFDLLKSDTITNIIKEITDQAFQILCSMDIINDLKEEELYGQSGNERPVSNLYRHNDKLHKQTDGIFNTYKREQKYYLDVVEDDSISKDKLAFLFNKILENKELDSIDLEKISDFCLQTSKSKGILLFDSSHKFDRPKYDKIIRDVVKFNI